MKCSIPQIYVYMGFFRHLLSLETRTLHCTLVNDNLLNSSQIHRRFLHKPQITKTLKSNFLFNSIWTSVIRKNQSFSPNHTDSNTHPCERNLRTNWSDSHSQPEPPLIQLLQQSLSDPCATTPGAKSSHITAECAFYNMNKIKLLFSETSNYLPIHPRET